MHLRQSDILLLLCALQPHAFLLHEVHIHLFEDLEKVAPALLYAPVGHDRIEVAARLLMIVLVPLLDLAHQRRVAVNAPLLAEAVAGSQGVCLV